jgi:hypothetical protein
MAIAQHAVHETKDGKLELQLMVDPDRSASTSLISRFESSSTGAIYEGTFDAEAVGRMHKMFIGMPESLIDYISEIPTITCTPDHVVAHWSINVFKSTMVEFDVCLAKKVYEGDAHQGRIIELEQENRVLRKKVADLEARMVAVEDASAEYKRNIAMLAEICVSQLCESDPRRFFEFVRLSGHSMNHLPYDGSASAMRLGDSTFEVLVAAGLDVNRYDKTKNHYFFTMLEKASTPAAKFGDGDVELLDFKIVDALARAQYMIDMGLDVGLKYHGDIPMIDAVRQYQTQVCELIDIIEDFARRGYRNVECIRVKADALLGSKEDIISGFECLKKSITERSARPSIE